MIQIEVGGRRHAVSSGEFVLGSDPSSGIFLEGPDVLTRHAIVELLSSGEAAIRVASPAAEVRVNGVRLGAEPTPLLHGDKITRKHNLIDICINRRFIFFYPCELGSSKVAGRIQQVR